MPDVEFSCYDPSWKVSERNGRIKTSEDDFARFEQPAVTSVDDIEDAILHKFAEEAMYKWIAYGVLSTKINTPEHIIQRFKKEKFAETRKAKLRLSNI